MGATLATSRNPLAAFEVANGHQLPTTILVPDVFKQLKTIPNLQLCPSTPAGSFAKKSLPKLQQISSKAAAVLMAGNISANQETQQLLLAFISKLAMPVVLNEDAALFAEANPFEQQTNIYYLLDSQQLDNCLKHHLGQTIAIDHPAVLSQALSDLPANLHLLAYDGRRWWARYNHQLVATPAKALNRQVLAVELIKLLLDNPQQVWQSLVSAPWRLTDIK